MLRHGGKFNGQDTGNERQTGIIWLDRDYKNCYVHSQRVNYKLLIYSSLQTYPSDPYGEALCVREAVTGQTEGLRKTALAGGFSSVSGLYPCTPRVVLLSFGTF